MYKVSHFSYKLKLKMSAAISMKSTLSAIFYFSSTYVQKSTLYLEMEGSHGPANFSPNKNQKLTIIDPIKHENEYMKPRFQANSN